jgi:hypothetical protein
MTIFKREPKPQPTQLATALNNAGIGAEELKPATSKGGNIIDLLETLDRRSQLAGLRSLTGAVQFTLINTADWIARREAAAQASDDPTLDERNTHDEFARGQDEVDEVNRLMFGQSEEQSPEAKLKQYSHLYYGLVHLIRNLNPQPFERPKGIRDALKEFLPRSSISEEAMKLLEAAEAEPGEFAAARDAFKTKRTADLNERKPRILQLLELHADCNPMTEVFDELPKHIQLRLTTAAWKGVYFSRKQLVGYIAMTGKTDDIAAVKTMQHDLEIIGKFCEDYESQADNRAIFDLLLESGMTVYGIDDARKDVKKPRN